MEITFFGVRGTIPSPGPATVRYGGNTSCVLVKTDDGDVIILDCGTGARNLGLSLRATPFGQGKGRAALLLSHAHWDHIQGFPFFGPFYVPGNHFTIWGLGKSAARLEEILEGQMAAQYFPVQTFRNMGATLELRAVEEGQTFDVGRARVRALGNPHGPTTALAFRIEAGGKVLVYASDAGYGPAGPSAEAIALYRDADLLIHDSTYTPGDRAPRHDRGLSSVDEAVAAALGARVRRLALFHYDQDYGDHEVDALVARARRRLDEGGGAAIEVFGAAEAQTVRL
jgi:phosphoribosyl 1,2-cyclic phosphodiesterase